MTPREQALSLIASEASSGPAFWRAAARALALQTGCRWAGVGRLQDDGDCGELLALWDHLAESAGDGEQRSDAEDPGLFFRDGVLSGLPLLQETGARSFRSELFFDADGRPVGHVFVMGVGGGRQRDEADDADVRDFFRLVAGRVGSEYRRWRAEEARAAEVRQLTRRQRQLESIAKLALHEMISSGDVETACRLITREMEDICTVARVSVWLFDRDRLSLRCHSVSQRSRGHGGPEPVLAAEEFPHYIEALGFGRPIAARDACSDPRTRELARSYLVPAGIVSTLDAPIQASGSLAGVLRCEHRGEPRTWLEDESAFAGDVAHLIGRAIAHRDRRLFAHRLGQAQKMESLGVLAGGIAHDFNNLLVGVLGGADLAQVHLPADSPARRHLEMISRSAVRASDLCSQMLAYAGRGQFLLETVDLSAVIEESLEILRSVVPEGVELCLRLESGLPTVEVDIGQLRQVVLNLLANACEAMAESAGGPGQGMITIETGSRECTRADFEDCLPAEELIPGLHVYLEVSDSGGGMDEATRSRVCEPFFSTKFTGRGLGLSAVLGIVRSQGGGIAIRSEPGAGTSIRAYFPEAATAVGIGFAPIAQLDEGETRGTVLVVDDEDVVRQVVAELLHSWGFGCLLADGGKQAIELFEHHADAVDLVLLDVTMPDLPGEKVLDHLHERRPELPVIMASGFSEQALAERFAGREIAGFIHKPFHPEKLREILRHALSRRPERRLRAIG
ncbi:MAG: response regulator [Thermoanaerobaculia bacterium]